MQENLGQPGSASEATIANMQHFFAPDLVNVAQNILFFVSFLALRFPACGPPAHVLLFDQCNPGTKIGQPPGGLK